MKKVPNTYPPGWTKAKVLDVIRHYEGKSEDEAIAEDEATFAESELEEKMRDIVELLQPYEAEQLEAAIQAVARAEVEHDDPIRPLATTSLLTD